MEFRSLGLHDLTHRGHGIRDMARKIDWGQTEAEGGLE